MSGRNFRMDDFLRISAVSYDNTTVIIFKTYFICGSSYTTFFMSALEFQGLIYDYPVSLFLVYLWAIVYLENIRNYFRECSNIE